MALTLELKLFELLASNGVCTGQTFLIGTRFDTVDIVAHRDSDT